MLKNLQFDFYYTIGFWAALLIVGAAVRLFGANGKVRAALLFACSTLMLLAIPHFRVVHLLAVWFAALGTFAFNRALHSQTDARKRRAIAVAGVLFVVGFLAFFKYHFIQAMVWGGAASFVFLLGVSYFAFKAIHVIVESYKGKIGKLDALCFLNYLTFFPAFISGPINRYPQFCQHMQAPSPGERSWNGTLKRDLKLGGERIIHGLFKKFVLVALLQPHILINRQSLFTRASLGEVLLALYASSLYFYFDFSGYSDLAIGSARVLGFELPENFKWPFLRRNIRELWTYWHMSLTGWLIDYIYWPIVRRLRAYKYFKTRPVFLSIIGMNVTFVACGIWHGESPHFVLWGAYHGLGITVLQLYQRQQRSVTNPWLLRYFGSKASAAVGAILTFNFFAVGLLLFILDLQALGTLLAALKR